MLTWRNGYLGTIRAHHRGPGDSALVELSAEFDQTYTEVGRPLRLCSDQALLFRWFLDMQLVECSSDPTVFINNRNRLLERQVAQARALACGL